MCLSFCVELTSRIDLVGSKLVTLLRMNLLPSAKSGPDKFDEDHFLFVAVDLVFSPVVPGGVLWLWAWVALFDSALAFRLSSESLVPGSLRCFPGRGC